MPLLLEVQIATGYYTTYKWEWDYCLYKESTSRKVYNPRMVGEERGPNLCQDGPENS
jgi:hypothetical protein